MIEAEKPTAEGKFWPGWRIDPVLLIALVLALGFGLYGINWGRVECWNRDQMALRGLHGLKPSGYTKPPLHTYLNHLLVLGPLDLAQAAVKYFSGHAPNWNVARLLGSRLLVLAMSLGTMALAYTVSLNFFGRYAARVTTLAFATGAGFVEYNHFLSCDSPLLFWIMLTLYYAQRIILTGKPSSYLLAGLLTGLSTATKYNGLAVGLSIVVAHLLSKNWSDWKSLFFHRSLLLGLLMVPLGFLIGNPYSIFDSKKFIADFMYNYTVTPRYEGQEGHGYLQFFSAVPEVIGLPGTVACLVAVVVSFLILLIAKQVRSREAQGFVLFSLVFILYFVKIGSFPRMPARFVLPAVPLLLLMVGPFFRASERWWKSLSLLMLPLFLYNCICCVYVGRRLNDDPRMAAQTWMQTQLPQHCLIESSGTSPHWEKLPGLNAVGVSVEKPNWKKVAGMDKVDVRMPHVNGRAELFGKLFKDNSWVTDTTLEHEGSTDDGLFGKAQLGQRNPDYITIYSTDYEVQDDVVKSYYLDLLAGRLPYHIVFDGETSVVPAWVYPHEIDFLRGRMTILARKDLPASL